MPNITKEIQDIVKKYPCEKKNISSDGNLKVMCESWDSDEILLYAARIKNYKKFQALKPYYDNMLNFLHKNNAHVLPLRNIFILTEYKINTVNLYTSIDTDYCEYTVLQYYQIDSGITVGDITMYDSYKNILSTFKPKLNQIYILSGLYSIAANTATTAAIINNKDKLCILTIQVNPFNVKK